MRNKQLAISATLVSGLSLVNLAIGFLLQVVLAAYFGANTIMDAYLAASTIPTTINLVFVGALNITVVPLYVDYCMNYSQQEAWRIVNSVINLLIALFGLLIIILYMFSVPIMKTIAPGLETYGTLSLSVNLLVILLPSILFIGISGVLTGVYYAEKRFLLPSIGLISNNLVTLLVAVVFASDQKISIIAMGVLLGSITQFLLLTVPLATNYRFDFNMHHPGVSKLLGLAIPWILGSLVGKLNPLIDRMIASHFAEGAISQLGYAFLVVVAITTFTSKGLSVTILPEMSALASQKKLAQLSKLYSTSVCTLMLILGLVTIWIMVSGGELIQVLFERNEFTSSDTKAVASLMIAFLGYYICGTIGILTTSTLYAMQNTLMPAVITTIGFFIYIAIAILLSNLYQTVGLAMATSAEYLINLIVLSILLHHNLRQVDIGAMFTIGAKILLSAVCAVIISKWLTESFVPISNIFILSIIKVVISSIIYAFVLLMLRTEQVTLLLMRFIARKDSLYA